MAKTTKQARSVELQATVAGNSAPITADDVFRFNNPENVQASNALVGSNISDTLENCAAVLAFLSDFHARTSGSQMNGNAETGLCLVVDWVLDAVEKQSSELEVTHG